MFSWCCWTLLLPTSSWQWTNLTPLTSNELVLDYTKGCRDWQSHSAMERATERMSATRMHICEVYNKSFTRKDNLSQHLSVHGKKRFQCNHCSKCYSRWKKLKVHIFRHHTNDKQKFSNKSLSCGHCSKVFGWSFNFRRHIAVCKKKSVEATKSDMEAMIIEMTSAEREYRQKLEVGETVSTLLHANELLSEESLMDKYKKALRWKLWSFVSTVASSACASIWTCHTEAMAKGSIGIHSTTYPSGGYFGRWSTGRGRQDFPSKLYQVSLQWQQVEEQAPKPVGWTMCFLLMILVPVQKLCVNIYVYTFLIRVLL